MKPPPQPDSAEPQRVFVALWPPPEAAEQLGALAAGLAHQAPHSRAIPAGKLHLTLAFIGAVTQENVVRLARALGEGAPIAFDWSIDRLGHFERARVIWAGGAHNEALQELARGVRSLLDAAGVGYDRKAFVPHVTLLRDVRHWKSNATTITPPITWRCGAPTLVRSIAEGGGVCYAVVSAAST